jgi:protoporphyrinogen oxidase
MDNYIVVGGGVAGLVSAIILKTENANINVFLIESESECGGLLRSIRDDSKYVFDYGAHVLSDTGNTDLDGLLYSNLNDEEWHKFKGLKPGNYFNNELYESSQMIPIHRLSVDDYKEALYQLLTNLDSDESESNKFIKYSISKYGCFITNKIFSPILEKLLGCNADKLHKDVLRLFGYSRVILGEDNMMKQLKKSPRLDDIIAYASHQDGVSELYNYYPKNGVGIGEWVKSLVKNAENIGVNILTGSAVTSIDMNGSSISSINVNDKTIECKHIIWSAPLYPLINNLSINYEVKYRPSFRKMMLYHFVFDAKFLTENHYIYCNDVNMKSFRITLYSNLDSDYPHARCTVEVFSDTDENNFEDICLELIKMNIVSSSAKILYKSSTFIGNGFPVYTSEFVDEFDRQQNFVLSNVNNITLVGKGSSGKFFMNEVLLDVYKKLKNETGFPPS